MSHTVTVTYDRPLVRRALNRFMLRRLGPSFFVALFGGILILSFMFFTGSWMWLSTLFAAAMTAALLFLAFVYFARLRAAEGFFDKANEPTVTFRITTDGVRTESELGTSDLKWLVFEEIPKFRDVWLIVYAKSGYLTLPLDQLTPECSQFIEEQVAKHGSGLSK